MNTTTNHAERTARWMTRANKLSEAVQTRYRARGYAEARYHGSYSAWRRMGRLWFGGGYPTKVAATMTAAVR